MEEWTKIYKTSKSLQPLFFFSEFAEIFLKGTSKEPWTILYINKLKYKIGNKCRNNYE